MFSGSLVAIVTPMYEDGRIDEASFVRLIELHRSAGTDGIVVAGTTGEGASLSAEEHRFLLRLAVESIQHSLPVIAGIGSPATHVQQQQLEQAMDCGVDAVLAVTPYYLRTTQQGLVRHYRTLADNSDIPLILYNVPARTCNDLLPESVVELASHERVVAIKEAVPDVQRIIELRRLLPESFTILSGDDNTAAQALANGADGVISVTANVAPSVMQQLVSLSREGRLDHAQVLDKKLANLHHLLGSEPNPIPVKAALAHLGLIPAGIRLPLEHASSAISEQINQLLDGDAKALVIHA